MGTGNTQRSKNTQRQSRTTGHRTNKGRDACQRQQETMVMQQQGADANAQVTT